MDYETPRDAIEIAANLGIEPDDVQDVLVSRDDCMDAEGRATQDAKAEAWMPGATDFDKFDGIEFGRTSVRREAASARDGASQYAPFSQHGGLGKVHQLFGDKLNAIIEELNETLAA